MKKLCIFDLDGTLLDTLTTIAYYANFALEQHGISPIDRDEYRYLVGDGVKNLIHRMLTLRGCDTPERYDAVFETYNKAYNAAPTYLTSIFPGLREVLDRLKEQGIRMIVYSNKPDYATRYVTEALYGEGYFEEIIGQREGVPIKPDPIVLLSLLPKKNLAPNDCIYIGDTATDMRTGKNVGIDTVGVLWGFRERDELLATGADAIAADPHELYDIITER